MSADRVVRTSRRSAGFVAALLALSSACQAMKRAVQIAAYGTGSKNKTIALAEEQRWRSRRPLFASVTRLKFASAYMPLAKSVTDVSLPRFSYSYRDESPEVYPKVSQRVDKMP